MSSVLSDALGNNGNLFYAWSKMICPQSLYSGLTCRQTELQPLWKGMSCLCQDPALTSPFWFLLASRPSCLQTRKTQKSSYTALLYTAHPLPSYINVGMPNPLYQDLMPSMQMHRLACQCHCIACSYQRMLHCAANASTRRHSGVSLSSGLSISSSKFGSFSLVIGFSSGDFMGRLNLRILH